MSWSGNDADSLAEILPKELSETTYKLQDSQNVPAAQSDSTSGSSNATPFRSPPGELADEPASKETSVYLTPRSDVSVEKVSEDLVVHSSPESDRNDGRSHYAQPEIKLGDIHKV